MPHDGDAWMAGPRQPWVAGNALLSEELEERVTELGWPCQVSLARGINGTLTKPSHWIAIGCRLSTGKR